MKSFTATALAALLTFSIGPAFAHAHLAAAVPAPDTSAAAPQSIAIEFTEAVEPAFTGLTLTGPDGSIVPLGAAAPDSANPALFVVTLATPLAIGLYTVDWHTVATDGHKSTGTYSFTIVP